MARSDLLINLVKAGASGDQSLFRKTVDALIAEERGKNHGILADRLTQAATPRRSNGHVPSEALPLASSQFNDLFFEITPRRGLEGLILPDEVRNA